MDKKILQIKFSFPIPLNAKFSVLPGSGLMRFSQYAYGKNLIGCLLILSAQGLLENSADQVNQLRDIPSFYGVIGETTVNLPVIAIAYSYLCIGRNIFVQLSICLVSEMS